MSILLKFLLPNRSLHWPLAHEEGQNKVNKAYHLYKENTPVDWKNRGCEEK